MIRGKLGIAFDTDLEPVMEHDHKIVIHDETYVSSEGTHINQVECLFSVIKPWPRKFRGLSKH